jgi:Rrf2 family nitric oxide-sensitive transcriptional repressor
LLSKTVLLATRALVVIGKEPPGVVLSPRSIAMRLNESPAYMAKVARQLVRAGILRAERGALGGVFLSRPTSEITLLEIVQACQGTIRGAYCQPVDDLHVVCAFHRAAVDLEGAVLGVLSRWTLRDIEQSPHPSGPLPGAIPCMMAGLLPAASSRSGVREHKGDGSA